MAAAAGDRSLKETPTWAVAIVCAFFVIISLIIEHGIHSLGKFFQKRHKKALNEALEKIKAELMLVGFISLLLTVGTNKISEICITPKAGDTMLPCAKEDKEDYSKKGDGRRKLLWLAQDVVWRRSLAAAGGNDYCTNKNKVPLISSYGVHQLHIFIFVLAVFHVVYSIITMGLGQAKMNKWKSWESETTSVEYQFTNDPERFRFAHQTSFVRRHTGFSMGPGLKWIVAFFRQFSGSVSKVDYLTMRHGFINAHLAPNSKFDFHKYIKRSMEDDFKVVVGISIPLWIFATVFLLLNVYNWYTLFWISFVPLIILLLVGTKLELIIMEMAQQIQARSTVVKGAPLVEPSNKLFWFNRPQWILFLIHFALFQNAFQMAYFLWIWYEFGIKSCFHENMGAILTRVILGVALQFVCSYITFPLYSLVTQIYLYAFFNDPRVFEMGSHMKKAIFEEQTVKAISNWRKAAKARKKLNKNGVGSTSGFMSGENTPSIGSSPIHMLHNYQTKSTDIEGAINSPTSYLSETDLSENDSPSPMHHDDFETRRHDQPNRDGEIHSTEFSFGKP